MTSTPNRTSGTGYLARRLGGVAAVAVLAGALVGCSSGSSTAAKKHKTTTTTAAPATDIPAVDAGANSGSGSSTGNQTNPASSNGGQTNTGGSTAPAPTIVSFTTPENIDCHNGNSQMFTASWSTTNAVKVTISIDGPGVYNTYPANGSESLPFNCSSSHSFLLTAYGQDGRTVSRTVTLDPRNVQTSTPEPDQP
ncbi:MAG: hypothetical protein JJE46_15110 [Acidimicrobiia bacterium]|nr:hypothetical protein [Acidimicrobiia bacterium]